MPTVLDILSLKGDIVHAVSPQQSVLDAVNAMNRHRIGALVVMDDGTVTGMFTERDVLRLVGRERDPANTAVGEVMTTNVYYCTPGMQLDEVGEIMRQQRIRHLPVCDEYGRLLGMLSIGDLNAYHVQHQEATISALNDYIHGRV